jgi:16S rRNA processing protein RimM
MKYINVGKIVNTHALKGEVRIISNFEYKDRVFKKGFNLYIGQFKDKEVIETYRVHKHFDMVKFVGIDYINDVLKYKGNYIYASIEDLNLDDNEILESEFINMKVYSNNEEIGIITEYRNDNGNKMIRINDKFIPYNKDFITRVDKKNNIIYMHDIEVFL